MDEREEEGYLQEDDIDVLKLPQAIGIAKERNVDISTTKNINDIKCCLKRSLLIDRQKRRDVIKGLTTSAYKDAQQRQELLQIYEAIVGDEDMLSKNLLSQLSQSFPEPLDLLKKEKQRLEQKLVRCPIMVLGETGAGKSSFINLVLGCELLPHSLLSNTSAICEIQYGDTYSVDLHHQNGEKESHSCDTLEEFRQLLSTKIQDRSEDNLPVYKRAELRLPLDILETGLLIVDSPGIGETGSMTDLVLDYLMEACAFIYVINSQSAGGISPLQELLKKVVERAFRDKDDFRSECAIFVCNKWDLIPFDERKSVHKDTVKKLTSSGTGWPNCQPSQIFMLSTKEASKIQQSQDRYVVGRFNKILQEINQLVPKGREVALWNSARLLRQILERALFCIDHNIMKIKMDPEERKKVTQDTIERLTDLKNEVNTFFDVEKTHLFKGLEQITRKLSDHLKSTEKITKICTFKESDIPKDKQWKEATIIVRSKLYDRLTQEIHCWESDQKQLEKLGTEIADRFRAKFPDFDSKLLRVQRLSNTNTTGKSLLEEESPFIPTPVAKSFSNLNLGLKVLVGVSLSPVFLIGAIVRLPVWAITELKRRIESISLESGYEKDKEKALKKYAESTLKATVDPVKMKPILEEEVVTLVKYLEQQRSKVIQQIDADLSLFVKEKNSEKTEIALDTCPMQRIKFDWLLRRVLLFYKMNLPLPYYFIPKDSLHIRDLIHNGLFSSVYMAECDCAGLESPDKNVIVRKSKIAIDETNITTYLKIEETYRNNQMVFSLKCLAMVMEEQVPCQIFLPVECSLRTMLSRQGRPADQQKTYYIYMDQVVSGLSFLHQKNLVHMDLSLDSVFVDENGKLKLVDMNSPGHRHSSFFPPEATDISRYVHFHPSIIDGTKEIYSQKHDMYSIGIMMFEMWKGEKAFKSQIDNAALQIHTLKDFVEYISNAKNMLILEIEDGLGIVTVNNWNNCIIRCQLLEINVTEWFDQMRCCTYSQAQCPVPGQ